METEAEAEIEQSFKIRWNRNKSHEDNEVSANNEQKKMTLVMLLAPSTFAKFSMRDCFEKEAHCHV